jgi:hypothetical protein
MVRIDRMGIVAVGGDFNQPDSRQNNSISVGRQRKNMGSDNREKPNGYRSGVSFFRNSAG